MTAARASRPIFVVGCPRSGTTLLSAMLHAHPRIAMPPETRFLIPVYRERRRFGDLRVRANRRRLARRMTRPSSRFDDLGLDRRTVIRRIVDGPPTIGSAAGTVWREYAQSRGKARWGEKRPIYWRYLDVVLRLFPDAQVVHLVRDGRACVASLKQVDWWTGGVLDAMATWTLAERELGRVARRLPPDAIHRMRYEDLLDDPAGQLGRLCAFLGEDFDAAMLDHAAAAGEIVPERKRWHDRTRERLDPGRVDAWRGVLTGPELGLFELVAGRRLRAHGYAVTGAGARPSPSGVARYSATVARHAAAITRFRVLDARQRRREHVPLADAASVRARSSRP
jgi:Sulfotransferase family